jgi:hypothetical protein
MTSVRLSSRTCAASSPVFGRVVVPNEELYLTALASSVVEEEKVRTPR